MKLSIIPRVNQGESLTSWIMRTCIENQIKFVDLPIYKSRQKNIDSRVFHKIDINPESILDYNKASQLFGKSERFFNDLSYRSIAISFKIPIDSTTNLTNNFLFDSLVMRNRKFCPHCLSENIFFKLEWQFSDLKFCLKHNCLLTTTCPKCDFAQPFYHNALAMGLCKNCSGELEKGTVPFSPLERETEVLYNQVLTLLNPKNNILFDWSSTTGVSLIHVYLYICTDRSPLFRPKDIKYISRDTKYKILRILTSDDATNPANINLMSFLSVLRKQNISFSELLKIAVPNGFLLSLEGYVQRKSYIKCLSPWCENFNSSNSLHKLNNLRSKTHNNIHYCPKCFLKFGLNKSNDIWEEYGDIINLAQQKTLPLLLQKQTQISIARNIKISRFKLSKIISYLAQQKLLSSDLVNFYLKLDYNRISNITFMEIKEYEGETKLIKVIKKTNNLTLNEAYYYFFDSSYQKYLLKKFF